MVVSRREILSRRCIGETQQLFRAVDLAALCGVSETTVARWKRDGLLPAPVRIHGSDFWNRQTVTALTEGRR